MARVNFVDTVVVPLGPAGSLIGISGIAMTPYTINPDQTEGPQATAYAGRTGAVLASTLASDATGTVSYWLDAGDYNIHYDDPLTPPRITSRVRGFTAPVIDTNTLIIAAQNLIQFTGDLKHSMQINDHGLKPDGTFEWLLIKTDGSLGGRKVSSTDYSALWALMGSPAPDGLGNFVLPNISGRALIATGQATASTSIRTLLQMLGEENHQLTVAEHASHAHPGSTGTSHQHAMPPFPSNSGGSFITHAYADGGGIAAVAVSGGAFATSASTGNGTGGVTVASQGGDTAHNNIQPSTAMNLFVKS